jgi:hypothetical protein
LRSLVAKFEKIPVNTPNRCGKCAELVFDCDCNCHSVALLGIGKNYHYYIQSMPLPSEGFFWKLRHIFVTNLRLKVARV